MIGWAAVEWERDPDTDRGEVTSCAVPRAQAREMVAALIAAGWEASDAADHDDPALSWVYRVREHELDLAAREAEIAAVEAAILLVSDVTSDSYQDDDNSYIIAIADDGGDDAARDLARVAAALPPNWRIDWTGNGNTDAYGHSTSDARVWRDDDAEDAADGVPLRVVAGRRVDLDGMPHLLVGTLGCEPEHGDGTREADLLVEAGILGERHALREENCWAYPIRHDDRGLAVAACPEVAPYLAGRAEAERKARERAAAARGAS